jgi:hypothetical protein
LRPASDQSVDIIPAGPYLEYPMEPDRLSIGGIMRASVEPVPAGAADVGAGAGEPRFPSPDAGRRPGGTVTEGV